ncbi:MAG: DUF493 family protein [Bacteroidetes bacterium]|nr:DUF493 family protein [Bacteroidota bacterium]
MKEEDFQNLRQKIIESTSFPTVYMFKFIVESNNRKIALISSLFDEGADLHTKESSNGRYTSITAKQVLMTVDEIIAVYKKASEVDGVIFL